MGENDVYLSQTVFQRMTPTAISYPNTTELNFRFQAYKLCTLAYELANKAKGLIVSGNIQLHKGIILTVEYIHQIKACCIV